MSIALGGHGMVSNNRNNGIIALLTVRVPKYSTKSPIHTATKQLIWIVRREEAPIGSQRELKNTKTADVAITLPARGLSAASSKILLRRNTSKHPLMSGMRGMYEASELAAYRSTSRTGSQNNAVAAPTDITNM
jgi:hypothetical protein